MSICVVTQTRQRISTFRLAVKRVADAHVVAHYNLNPGNAIQRVRELFEYLTYMYPFTEHTVRNPDSLVQGLRGLFVLF